MSPPDFTSDPRRAMTPARKRRIHKAWNGVCYFCRQPVDLEGPGVIYDHVTQLWMNGSDADEGIGPIHTHPCNDLKTAADATKRAKVKRIIAKNDPEREREASRLKGGKFRGWRNFKGEVVRAR